jgi:hypothetical protein
MDKEFAPDVGPPGAVLYILVPLYNEPCPRLADAERLHHPLPFPAILYAAVAAIKTVVLKHRTIHALLYHNNIF